MTPLETQAMENLRTKGSLTLGRNIGRVERKQFGLKSGDVLPSVARGLESRGMAAVYRPAKKGPAVMIARAGIDMDAEEWRSKALIYDVFFDGEKRGQVAAVTMAEAAAEAIAAFNRNAAGKQLKRVPLVELVVVGAMYGVRR